jgi:hypothetical protein
LKTLLQQAEENKNNAIEKKASSFWLFHNNHCRKRVRQLKPDSQDFCKLLLHKFLWISISPQYNFP